MQAARAEGQAPLSASWWLRDRAARLAGNVAAMRAGRKRYIERQHLLGLKAPGGRPPGPLWKRARFVWMVEQVVKHLPAPLDKPVESWSHAEILADGARHGLLRMRELALRGMNGEPWEQRLIYEASHSLSKLYAQVQEAQLRQNASPRRSPSSALPRCIPASSCFAPRGLPISALSKCWQVPRPTRPWAEGVRRRRRGATPWSRAGIF